MSWLELFPMPPQPCLLALALIASLRFHNDHYDLTSSLPVTPLASGQGTLTTDTFWMALSSSRHINIPFVFRIIMKSGDPEHAYSICVVSRWAGCGERGAKGRERRTRVIETRCDASGRLYATGNHILDQRLRKKSDTLGLAVSCESQGSA